MNLVQTHPDSTAPQAAEQTPSTKLEQPLCKHCGQVRRPVMYSVCTKPVGTVPLCDNHCCPDCGATLALHETPKKKYRYWTHELPLPMRICECGCLEEFMPLLSAPHSKTKNRRHHERRAHRNYYLKNREVLNQASKQTYFNLKAKVAEADEAKQLVLDLRVQVAAAKQAVTEKEAKLAAAEKKADKWSDVGRDAEDKIWAYVDGLEKQGLKWKVIKSRADAKFDFKRTIAAYDQGLRRYRARQEKPTK